MDYLTVQEFQDSIEVIKEQLTIRDNPEFYYVVQGDGGQIIYKTDLIPGEGGGDSGEYNGPFGVSISGKLELTINPGVIEYTSQNPINEWPGDLKDFTSDIDSSGDWYVYLEGYYNVDFSSIEFNTLIKKGIPKREFATPDGESFDRNIYPVTLAKVAVSKDDIEEGEDQTYTFVAVEQAQYGWHQIAGVLA